MSAALDRLVRLGFILCEIALVAMTLLIAAEVIVRSVANYSLQATDEVGGYLLAAIAFLGLAPAFASGSLFRVEFLLHRLPPRAQALIELLFHVVALGFAALLEHHVLQLVLSSWRTGRVAPTLLATPLWIPQLVLPVGVALLIVAIIAGLLRDAKALAR
jgi:TRAP-type C4-dicarboxylate transport system permease small subunit